MFIFQDVWFKYWIRFCHLFFQIISCLESTSSLMWFIESYNILFLWWVIMWKFMLHFSARATVIWWNEHLAGWVLVCVSNVWKRSPILCKYKLSVKLVNLEYGHLDCVLCMTHCDLKDRVNTMGEESKDWEENINIVFRYLLKVGAY